MQIEEKMIKYFYDSKSVCFNVQRENEFREFLDFGFENFHNFGSILNLYYNKVCLNPKAFSNEFIVIKDICITNSIFLKKWIQHKKTKRFNK